MNELDAPTTFAWIEEGEVVGRLATTDSTVISFLIASAEVWRMMILFLYFQTSSACEGLDLSSVPTCHNPVVSLHGGVV